MWDYIFFFIYKQDKKSHEVKKRKRKKTQGLNCCLGMQWRGKTFTPFTVQISNSLACGRHITIHFSFEDFASCLADEEFLPLVLGA